MKILAIQQNFIVMEKVLNYNVKWYRVELCIYMVGRKVMSGESN